MGDNTTDAAAIAAVLEGDVDAFAVLVDRYESEFLAFAKYMTGSADEAADVLQESFVRAYRSLRRCKDRENFKGWLFRIVSNQCKTHLARRKRRKTESLADRAAELQASDNPHADLQEADVKQRVHEALQTLPDDQREALVLKYLHGLDISEMTKVLKASRSAIKMRLLRGREALREKLEGVAI